MSSPQLLARHAHIAFAALAMVFSSVFLAGCPDSSLAACGDERDVSGAWHLTLSPTSPDAGSAGIAATIDHRILVEAQLEQAGATDFLGIGHFVYGILTTDDPGVFGTLTIPRLKKNDGSKSGAVLGCALRINVPIAFSVSDDNVDQGPLRISLSGQIDAPGHILGTTGSQLIRSDDPSNTALRFEWQATR